MTNDRGYLPKADPKDLDDRLRARLDRWYDNAYPDDNLFLTLARRPGVLDATWGFVRYIYGGGSLIEPELFELVRKKLAYNNRCTHCSVVTSRAATEAFGGDGEAEEVLAALFDYERSELPARTKAALAYADRLSGEHTEFDDAEYTKLREHFSDDEILDLGMTIGFAIGWQRFNTAMGILPDSWRDGSPLPWDKVD
ncbi:MAG TPA: carboxymuconolactone decarboxylase family protein [Pseudonocardia sp.]|jgi:alkylhydroperoxidase family enzyme|nr:carboxymuconolactone decarboxylase family protein [Pseudonocardia sp.]